MMTVYNTTEELEAAKVDTAILPIGAIEQHGPHLPLATDLINAEEMAKRVAEMIGNCYLLPALPFSNSQEHLDFTGTVTLKPSTLALVLRDIVLSLYLQGIKKIIIIQGHGGNWIVKPTLRELNLEYPDLKVIHSGPMAGENLDRHAGEFETSRMLYLRRDLVKTDKIVDCLPGVTGEYMDYVGMKTLSEHGPWGRASRGTPEKGEKSVKESVERTVQYIYQTFKKLEELEHTAPERRSITPKPPAPDR